MNVKIECMDCSVIDTLLSGPRTGNLKAFIKRGEKAGMTGVWAAAVVMFTARLLGLQHSVCALTVSHQVSELAALPTQRYAFGIVRYILRQPAAATAAAAVADTAAA
eukprot:SAG31_NODE_683_length_12836_cov_8.304938_7_plen_107_part_00